METITSLFFLLLAILALAAFGVFGFVAVIFLSIPVQYGARRKKREHLELLRALKNKA